MKRKILIITTLILLLGFVFEASAQSTLIKGVVVDKEGYPLPGVNVIIKNSTNGVMTSIDGNYVLTGINENDSIKFSYLGYMTQIFRIGNKNVLDIIMEESSTLLEEYQVVAFQKQKKESVIGSINTINPKELKIPSSNLTTALGLRNLPMAMFLPMSLLLLPVCISCCFR